MANLKLVAMLYMNRQLKKIALCCKQVGLNIPEYHQLVPTKLAETGGLHVHNLLLDCIHIITSFDLIH